MKENTYARVLSLVEKANSIVAFTGAGISTNCGIPDFRGPRGLYSLAREKYHLPYPEALFDMAYFRNDPHPFFDFTKNFFLMDIQPGKCHQMLARLEDQGKIALVVTQNIDTLHQKAGSQRVIPCHGTFERAHCLDCRKAFSLEDIEEPVLNDTIPRCSCGGIIKPDVVFFGENLPDEFYRIMDSPPKADLILILGTSLNVQPASLFAMELVSRMPSVLVNLEETEYDKDIDVVLHDDLDLFAEALLQGMG